MLKKLIKYIMIVFFNLLLILMVASGQPPSEKVIDLDKGEENIRILGDDADDRSGLSVSSGDINGDGYDDVIIGAPYADSAGGNGAGETYVIFGRSTPKAIVDLNIISANITICGDDAVDFSGFSVSSGDINGDGYDDVIIGALGADPAGGDRAGKTYVIFGSASPRRKIDLNSRAADMVIYGDDAQDQSGFPVSSGDINGDGYDDVIIGAFYADPAGGTDAGETYVIFGSAAPPAVIDLNDSPSPADMIIYGDDAEDGSGYTALSGDVNGDNYDDIIIGAPWADAPGGTDAGEVYVILGSASPSLTIDLNDSPSPADMIIYGDNASDEIGAHAISSRDINGDGCEDLILGAFKTTGLTGTTYVIFGSTTLPATIDLNDSPSPADMIIYGDDSYDWSGYSVSSGDINGDGYGDIIIGAPFNMASSGTEKGQTYVILGSAAPPSTIDLDSESADIAIYGDDNYDHCGTAVSNGDINGDGYDDVIIGAHAADPAGGTDAGETYVIFGSSVPITCDFSDIKVKNWQRIGTGTAIVRNEQLILRDAINFFRVFPPGALSNECDIEVKVKRNGGRSSRVRSSILFSHKDKRNYWELRMLLLPEGARILGKWILQHKKDGVIVQSEVINDAIYRRQQYLILLEVRENQIRVSVDGVEKINITPDEKPIWGNIALGIRGEGACFLDDLIIQ